VAALQTEAVLDVLTDEWVVNTPDEGAIKWWIGNAAEDGRAATVFARLKVPAQDGTWHCGVRQVPAKRGRFQYTRLDPLHTQQTVVVLSGASSGTLGYCTANVAALEVINRAPLVARAFWC
jgi:hypothetical protein